MSYGQYSNHTFERTNPLPPKAKRVREVYPSDRIAHLWAHQTQERARTAQGNFYFDGAVIYSYGSHFPIAAHVVNDAGEKAILFTTRTHSVTTAKQISEVRHAIPRNEVTVFHVALRRGFSATDVNHGDNMESYLSDIRELIEDGKSARGKKASHFLKAYGRIDEFNAYVAFFNLHSVALPVVPMTRKEASAEFLRQENMKDKARAKRDAAESFSRDWNDAHFFNAESSRVEYLKQGKSRWDVEAIERSQGYEKALERWMRGDNVYLGYYGYGHATALRVKGDEVETSRGASFPVSHAWRGLALVRAVMARGEQWETNGHSCHLGHYRIDRITPDGTVYAGCHVVTFAAIDRIAPILDASKVGQ